MNIPKKGKKTRVLTDDQKKCIENAFALFDTNSDGYLEYYELKAALRALGFQVKKAEVLRILQTYDKRDNKWIAFDDFYSVAMDKMLKQDPMQNMKYAFQLFVDGKSNGITFNDLRRVAELIGADLTEDEMRGMIEEFDTDGDGKINEQEFLAIMLGSDD